MPGLFSFIAIRKKKVHTIIIEDQDIFHLHQCEKFYFFTLACCATLGKRRHSSHSCEILLTFNMDTCKHLLALFPSYLCLLPGIYNKSHIPIIFSLYFFVVVSGNLSCSFRQWIDIFAYHQHYLCRCKTPKHVSTTYIWLVWPQQAALICQVFQVSITYITLLLFYIH